ncbi:vacuolar membrane amino acid uptake transporter Fnx2 [Schizosaccharomyces cryophilus OY26]|uniref:Vacuolar membrane amino acid uptake transporter Fnx2 n=1 Tax=Schizosaccharomyces cryophilus (strain OY26 / ATCC MYA-4695 / CBS 11777 / NBRC 106824 / NRRL Y48691) TaxID=653667 RepID=S9W1J6_SCHCR|nr:vacuolar membrane amino acid uptake transporter Fnx2 [Schizosaccharomyces cryophilus OY26]EPY53868.1 vacuolar membrane amino acid uptake transporter Fnx2 [Schizosaccharomyces cryophilus OY26]
MFTENPSRGSSQERESILHSRNDASFVSYASFSDNQKKSDNVNVTSHSQSYGDVSSVDKGKTSGTAVWKVLPALLLGVILSALDNTIVASTYTKIGAEFGKFNEISWAATSYMIACTAFQPLFGRFCEIYGRKSTLLFAYCVFGLGCLFCGLSQSLYQLVAARAIAGIGGGGMNSTVTILMSDLVPLKQRGTYQGIINVFFAVGSSLGGPIGGFFADQFTWRLGFFIQVPLLVAAFLTVTFFLHLPYQNRESFTEKFSRIDWLGLLLLISGVFNMTFALTLGGNTRAWSDFLVGTLIAGSLVSYVAFIYVETYVAEEPLAPITVLKDRTCLSAYLCNFFQSLSQLSWIYSLPIYYQAVMNQSTEKSGAWLIPMIVGSSVGSLLGGIVINMTGNYKRITVISYFVAFVGALCMLRYGLNTHVWEYILYPALGGLGTGISITTTLVAIIHASPPSLQASAIATSYLFRSNGCVLGVSVSSSIIQTSLKNQLRKYFDYGLDELVHQLQKDISFVHTLPEQIRNIVIRALLTSVHYTFLFTSISFFVALLISLFIRSQQI